jgi:uncharacterized iron-regulated membrane protein
VIGIWCAPVLFGITLTGLVMSYQWANDLLYRLTGSKPPLPAAAEARPAPAGGGGGRPAEGRAREERPARTAEGRATADLDALWARAERQVPGWVLISQRVPARPDGPLTFVIQGPTGWHPTPRSQLTLDPITAEVVRWEPFADQSHGRRLRSWVRPLHTGEAGGAAGHAVALIASGGEAVLVWTGLSLALTPVPSPAPAGEPGAPSGQSSQEASAD